MYKGRKSLFSAYCLSGATLLTTGWVVAAEPTYQIISVDARSDQGPQLLSGALQAEIVNRKSGFFMCFTSFKTNPSPPSHTTMSPMACSKLPLSISDYSDDQFAVTTTASHQDERYKFAAENTVWRINEKSGVGEACVGVLSSERWVCTPIPDSVRQ